MCSFQNAIACCTSNKIISPWCDCAKAISNMIEGCYRSHSSRKWVLELIVRGARVKQGDLCLIQYFGVLERNCRPKLVTITLPALCKFGTLLEFLQLRT